MKRLGINLFSTAVDLSESAICDQNKSLKMGQEIAAFFREDPKLPKAYREFKEEYATLWYKVHYGMG
jgi:hypothetical protein